LPATRANSKPQFADKELCSSKVIRDFRVRLSDIIDKGAVPLHRSFEDPKRRLMLGE